MKIKETHEPLTVRVGLKAVFIMTDRFTGNDYIVATGDKHRDRKMYECLVACYNDCATVKNTAAIPQAIEALKEAATCGVVRVAKKARAALDSLNDKQSEKQPDAETKQVLDEIQEAMDRR